MLALALILNGAFAPPVIAHVAMADGQSTTAHGMPMHCHHHDASFSTESTKPHKNKCHCCINGDACQCGCVVTLALPMSFSNLRPLAPLTLIDQLLVPGLAATPLHRLLRPPIV